MRNKKLIYAELIIIVVLLLAIILPQVIGTIDVPIIDGKLVSVDSIGTLTAAIAVDDADSGVARLLFPDTKYAEYDSVADAVSAVVNGDSDYFISKTEGAEKAVSGHPDLMIYPEVLKVDNDSVNAEEYFAVVRKSDYAFGITGDVLPSDPDRTVRIGNLLGVDTDENFDILFPNAKVDYFDNMSAIYAALNAGKIDYAIGFSRNTDEVLYAFPQFAKIYQPVSRNVSCLAAAKSERGERIADEFDEFLDSIKANGEYDALFEKWMSGDESRYVMGDYTFSGENGELKVVTGGEWIPYTFLRDGKISGILIEEVYMFASRYGYTPTVESAPFASELAGVTTGAYDFIADAVDRTPERETQMCFTQPVSIYYTMAYVKADTYHTKTITRFENFITSIKDGFTNNYITDNRYVTVLNGLLTTMTIAVLTMVFGTILGALICFMRMSSNSILQAFARIYIRVMQGIPIVVLLLVLFYVILAGVNISGLWVCVIGFSLDFSANVSETFRSGIEAVPKGQQRAAVALGFTKAGGFVKVVLPQAVRSIIPVYTGQFIAMVKMTSVAGYIAVQDLTKASDIVRAVTYDAFFPLIGAAVVYFLISSLLVLLLRLIESKTDIGSRPRKPKGVKADAV